MVGPWLRGQLAAFRAGAPNRPCLPLCAERPGCRLTVRLLMRPDDRHCLLLEEHSLDRRTACCRALGLTPREARVLAWVITGRPDAEIAVGLGVAPGTVENIWRTFTQNWVCKHGMAL